MSIPVSAVGGASDANKLPRFNSAGKLAGTMGGGNDELASLDGTGKLPAGQAPAKAVYSTGGVQALVAGDIGAQGLDATLTALAGLATGADKLPYSTGADTFSQADFTAFARTLLDDANGATARSTLGVGTGDSPQFTNLTLSGDLVVQGARVVVGGEKTAIADNYVDLNANYVTDAAQSCGIVANYDPAPGTAQQNIAAGGFVAGVASTSNPTVEVAATTGFVAGQIVRVQGSTSNDGFYEVDGVLASPARIRIKGIGTVAAVEDWTSNQFSAEAGAGNVTVCAVAVLRASASTGNWQVGKGSTVPISYSDILALAAGASGDLSVIEAGDAAAAGASGKYADAAHQHQVVTGAAVQVDAGTANAEGSGGALARANHTHAIPSAAPAAVGVATASGVGVSTSFARADHTHQSNTAAADIISGNGTIGTSGEPARADHAHKHPVFASGDLHSEYSKADGTRDFTGAVKTAGRKGTIQNLTASANINATADVARLDGASAAVDATLPAATGSGRMILANTINVTNATRVVPQAGDAIDGAANGVAKSLLAAYEGYMFVDVAANKWNAF